MIPFFISFYFLFQFQCEPAAGERRGRIFILISKFNNFWSKFCIYFVQLFIPQYLTNLPLCAIIQIQRKKGSKNYGISNPLQNYHQQRTRHLRMWCQRFERSLLVLHLHRGASQRQGCRPRRNRYRCLVRRNHQQPLDQWWMDWIRERVLKSTLLFCVFWLLTNERLCVIIKIQNKKGIDPNEKIQLSSLR